MVHIPFKSEESNEEYPGFFFEGGYYAVPLFDTLVMDGRDQKHDPLATDSPWEGELK